MKLFGRNIFFFSLHLTFDWLIDLCTFWWKISNGFLVLTSVACGINSIFFFIKRATHQPGEDIDRIEYCQWKTHICTIKETFIRFSLYCGIRVRPSNTITSLTFDQNLSILSFIFKINLIFLCVYWIPLRLKIELLTNMLNWNIDLRSEICSRLSFLYY